MQCTLFIKGNYSEANSVEFLQSGNEYFNKLIETIRTAQQEINLQLYYLSDDETGLAVIEALLQMAKQGIKIFVLLDAYGSRTLDKKFVMRMRENNISVRFFSPIIFSRLRTGRRLHHKLLVIDSSSALVSGINVADKYRGLEKTDPWIDFGILIKGDVCEDIKWRCIRLSKPKVARQPQHHNHKEYKGIPARLVQNNILHNKRNIYFHFKEAIKFSEKELVMVCSYFIPSFQLIRLMNQAAKRGVVVKLYLQGESDVPLARNATRYWYQAFFRSGIRVFEFPHRIMHGKLVIVDGKWFSIGSYNFNHLSDFTSVESNVEIFDEKFCQNVGTHLENVFTQFSSEIDPAGFLKKQTVFRQFKWWISHRLANFLMRLLFSLTSKERQLR